LEKKKNATPLSCAVALGCGFDGEIGIKQLSNSKILMEILSKKVVQLFMKNLEHFQNRPEIEPERVLKIKSLIDFDELVTMKINPKESLSEYYKRKSCRYLLENISIPTLIVNAEDDPIVHSSLAEFGKQATNNPNIIFAVTKYGGHIGWVRGSLFSLKKTTWGEKVTVEYIQKYLSSDFFLGSDSKTI